MTLVRPVAPAMPELDTDVLGDLAAPTAALLLHGAGADKRQLRPLADALAPEAAILPSLRGHGASWQPEVGYSPLDLAADLHRSAHRWPTTLDVVGYSYGAVVGLVSAATWAAGRVRSLVVIDTSFEALPHLHDEQEADEGSFLRWTYDYEPVLRLLQVPVLVVRSAAGGLLTDETCARIGALPHVDVVSAAGDHASVIDDPTTIARHIEEWRP